MRQVKFAQGNFNLDARIILVTQHLVDASSGTTAILRVVGDCSADNRVFRRARPGSDVSRPLHFNRMWEISITRRHHPARAFAREITHYTRHCTLGDCGNARFLAAARINCLAHKAHGIAMHHAFKRVRRHE